MTTLNLHHSKGFFRIFSKMGGAATAIGLLACIAFSGPTNAATFTLAELDAGQDFTIGNLEFFDWDVDVTTGDTNIITVDTVDSEILPGFVINLNGQMSLSGPEAGVESLSYMFSVRTVDERPLIDGGLLWVTDFHVMPNEGDTLSEIEVMLGPLGVILIDDADDPSKSASIFPPLNLLTINNLAEVRLMGPEDAGPAALNSYATLFTIVPEPGTALLLSLGLAGLVVVGRSRH